MPHLTFTLPARDAEASVAEIVLANPPQNRLTAQLVDEFGEAVAAIGRSQARAVLVRAEGPDFSFGGDFTAWNDMTARELRATFEHYLDVFNRFERLPVPVIAAVQGLCFGGGFELALRADLILAGEGARFGHPEQTLGITTLLGGIHRVAERAGRARAFEWALTSEQVPARVMADAGVVNRVVPDSELLPEAEALARRAATGPTLAHAAHKALLRSWATGGIAAADRDLFDLSVPLFDTQDVRAGLESAAASLRAGRPRPTLDFQGR
ncbi:enoyl-CoA hydratase/isomerase family protein [Streptomyces sp. NPDC055092]